MGLNLGEVLVKSGIISENVESSVYSITLFVTLLCVCIVMGRFVEKTRWMNESIAALAIGLVTGIVLLLTTEGKNSHLSIFNEDLFFIYLLPPIIFNAGFRVKKKRFFQNFITIALLGAFGTVISFAVISIGSWLLFKGLNVGFLDQADYLALGAIFSATDSVCTLQVLSQDETPLLYSLVFGEGVVNDATSVLLFNAIQRFDLSHITSSIVMELIGNFVHLFSTSTLLGIVVGLVSAYTIKKFGRHSTDREVALMMLMAYLSYMIAELFNLSGILTVFFCGIVMSHYTWHNVTEKSRVITKHVFATLSLIAEAFIFLYVGMDALDMEKWSIVRRSPGTSVYVSSILLVLVLIGRAASVFPLSLVFNLGKESKGEKINFKQQIIVWWAGLMRGAVSMALAYNKFTSSGHTQLPGNAAMITSTVIVVLFSTVVMGLLTKPLVKLLLLQPPKQLEDAAAERGDDAKSLTFSLLVSNDDDSSVCEMHHNNIQRRPSLQTLLRHPTNTVHYYWRRLDNSFMRPMFGGRGIIPQLSKSSSEESLN